MGQQHVAGWHAQCLIHLEHAAGLQRTSGVPDIRAFAWDFSSVGCWDLACTCKQERGQTEACSLLHVIMRRKRS